MSKQMGRVRDGQRQQTMIHTYPQRIVIFKTTREKHTHAF